MLSASVSLMSRGRRTEPTGRQAPPGLRIILSDVLKTKRADLQISASHWNDPETTQWTVSSSSRRADGDGVQRWVDVLVRRTHRQKKREYFEPSC